MTTTKPTLAVKVAKWTRQDWNCWRVLMASGKRTQAQCISWMNRHFMHTGRA